MATKFFSLKRNQSNNSNSSFSSFPSRRTNNKSLDASLFLDSKSQEIFLDQHGSVSVIAFKNSDINKGKDHLTNFLPAVGTYSSKVDPKIDPIPQPNQPGKSSVGEIYKKPYIPPEFISNSSHHPPNSGDPYYRENIARLQRSTHEDSSIRSRSSLSQNSSIALYPSYENRSTSSYQTANNLNNHISFHFDESDRINHKSFDAFYENPAIRDAERALTRNSKYPNGRPFSESSKKLQYKTPTINLESLENIMRASRESTQSTRSMPKALNDEFINYSPASSQLNLSVPRRRSNPKVNSARMTNPPTNLEVPTTLQELPEEQSDNESFYDPLPILSRPESELDQKNSLPSLSDRAKRESDSSSHEMYEEANQIEPQFCPPNINHIENNQVGDKDILTKIWEYTKDEHTLNSVNFQEQDSEVELSSSLSKLNALRSSHFAVKNKPPKLDNYATSQSLNNLTVPPTPPPKPETFLNLSEKSLTRINHQSLPNDSFNLINHNNSDFSCPLIVPPRPKVKSVSVINPPRTRFTLSPQLIPKNSIERESSFQPMRLSRENVGTESSCNPTLNNNDLDSQPTERSNLYSVNDHVVDQSESNLQPFLPNQIAKPESICSPSTINRDLESESVENNDPYKLRNQIFQECELPNQVAKAESVCSPSIINHVLESESNVNDNSSDIIGRVIDESSLDLSSLPTQTANHDSVSRSLLAFPTPNFEILENNEISDNDSNILEESSFSLQSLPEEYSKTDSVVNPPLPFPSPDFHIMKSNQDLEFINRSQDNSSSNLHKTGKSITKSDSFIASEPSNHNEKSEIIERNIHSNTQEQTEYESLSSPHFMKSEFSSVSPVIKPLPIHKAPSFEIIKDDQPLKLNRSLDMRIISDYPSPTALTHIPSGTNKDRTFGDHLESAILPSEIYTTTESEKLQKLEADYFKLKEESEYRDHLLNETTQLVIEESESRKKVEIELRSAKTQLDTTQKSLKEKSTQIEEIKESLQVAESELSKLRQAKDELSSIVKTNVHLQHELDKVIKQIPELQSKIDDKQRILLEKDDKLSQLEKEHTQLQSNFNSISQDLEDLRRFNQHEWLQNSRNSSFLNKARSRPGSISSADGRSRNKYSSRSTETNSSSGDITQFTIFEEDVDNDETFASVDNRREFNENSFNHGRVCSISNNSDESFRQTMETDLHDELHKSNERVKKLLRHIENRDRQIAGLNEMIKAQSKARSSALNNYNKLASRSMSQLNVSHKQNIFETAALTIQKLQAQLNKEVEIKKPITKDIDHDLSLSESKANESNISKTLFSPSFPPSSNPLYQEASINSDKFNQLPVTFKLNDIKYREYIEFSGTEIKERKNTDFFKRVMAEEIEYLICCDPNLNNWRTHRQILQALQNSELTLVDAKEGDHLTISDLVNFQSQKDSSSESLNKINNRCELCGDQPHHSVTPQFYYKLQVQSDPNPICSGCYHRLYSAQKFFKFMSQNITKGAGYQPHKMYFEVLQLKLDMFLARNGINIPNESENELIYGNLTWNMEELAK